jgi:hypothetical protein
MNREQAIKVATMAVEHDRAAVNRGCGPHYGPASLSDIVIALEALGLLKLDTPESIHQEGVDFIATMAKHASWQDPDVVAEDLANSGFVLVKSKRR